MLTDFLLCPIAGVLVILDQVPDPSEEDGMKGYTVTVDVVVPAQRAEEQAFQLDEDWRVDSWTPEAAAFEVVRKALESAGLAATFHRSTPEGSTDRPAHVRTPPRRSQQIVAPSTDRDGQPRHKP
jgi:hypothetical protein